MSCLGVHFSLSEDEVQQLYRLEPECARLEHLQEVIEPEYFEAQPERTAETDKAWDAIHRAFADGELCPDSREYPLNHVVLGGETLYSDSDYIMSLKTPDQVRDVAVALRELTEDAFRKRYFAIDPEHYSCLSEEDFAYTWSWLQELREFWLRAAEDGRYVLFTADQ